MPIMLENFHGWYPLSCSLLLSWRRRYCCKTCPFWERYANFLQTVASFTLNSRLFPKSTSTLSLFSFVVTELIISHFLSGGEVPFSFFSRSLCSPFYLCIFYECRIGKADLNGMLHDRGVLTDSTWYVMLGRSYFIPPTLCSFGTVWHAVKYNLP